MGSAWHLASATVVMPPLLSGMENDSPGVFTSLQVSEVRVGQAEICSGARLHTNWLMDCDTESIN
jgi:hypothetical protein